MSMPMIALDESPDGYRPGACNIGPAEIARRRRSGIVGLAIAAGLAAALLLVSAPPAVRWLVALPLAGGVIGLLQARLRFCAGFGIAGVRNFGPLGRVGRVEDPAARRADRARALAIAAAGAAAGLAGALLLVVLPA